MTEIKFTTLFPDFEKLIGEHELMNGDMDSSPAQGSGGVTVPGGVHKTFRCCTDGHISVGYTGDRWTVGLDDLRGLFQPW